jgi:O-antigen ligase
MAGAYFWVEAFFVVYCSRPEDWIPVVGVLHLAKVVGILAVVSFVLALGSTERRLPREVVYLFLLLGWMFLSSAYSPVWKGGAINKTVDFAKTVVIVAVMTMAVSTVARFRRLIFIQAASAGMIGIVSFYKGAIRGMRLEGAIGGIYTNPNDLALALVLTLPFCLFFMLTARSFPRKMGWAVLSMVMAYIVILTASRGGFIALALAIAVCLWHFGVKGRRFYLLIITMVLGTAFFLHAGKTLLARLEGTFNPGENVAHAYASSQARQQTLIKSLKVTAEHPLFGVGVGDYPIISGSWTETHNVYTAFSAEAGIPALLLFLLILRRAFSNLWKARKWVGDTTELGMIGASLEASMLAFAVASFFFPVPYHFFVYAMFAYTTVLYQIGKEKLETDSPAAKPHLARSLWGGFQTRAKPT